MADDITTLAKKLAVSGPFKTLPLTRQISVLFNGTYIARSTRPVYVWEHAYYPQLYLPREDFAEGLEIGRGETFPLHVDDEAKNGGDALGERWTLTVGPRRTSRVLAFADAAILKGHPAAPLAGLVKVAFDAVDAWFQEDEPILVHPKDPFKRVEVVASRRRVRVRVGGRVVADSWRDYGRNSSGGDEEKEAGSHVNAGGSVMHLFETTLPTRYYLPFGSVDPAVLRPSTTTSQCPYKGVAEYYTIEVAGQTYPDLVWYYRHPTPESAKVEGLLCFYAEKPGVELEVDGEVLAAPASPFATRKPNDKPSLE